MNFHIILYKKYLTSAHNLAMSWAALLINSSSLSPHYKEITK